MVAKTSNALPGWPFVFDPDKAVESVFFVVPQITDKTMHCVAKVLYHADKLHLSRYGRPISGDWYAAMEFGPVPSSTYDIFKARRGDERYKNYPVPARAHDFKIVNQKTISVSRAADLAVLSESERECLKESAVAHGHKDFNQRTDESHGPAWDATNFNGMMRLENVLLEIDNADELRKYFSHETT
jgi:uncharacterized phage-associated protein